MVDHVSTENCINLIDGRIEYRELHAVLNEVVAGFVHIYAYDVLKFTILAGLIRRPIHNLEDVNCLPLDSFGHARWCTLPYHKFPKFSCATKTENSLYGWLMYFLQKRDFAQCPPDMTRHTADFAAAL